MRTQKSFIDKIKDRLWFNLIVDMNNGVVLSASIGKARPAGAALTGMKIQMSDPINHSLSRFNEIHSARAHSIYLVNIVASNTNPLGFHSKMQNNSLDGLM